MKMLTGLFPPTEGTATLFEASVEAFRAFGNVAADLYRAPSSELIRALETEDDYDRPLAVQIAALLHVHGAETRAVPGPFESRGFTKR